MHLRLASYLHKFTISRAEDIARSAQAALRKRENSKIKEESKSRIKWTDNKSRHHSVRRFIDRCCTWYWPLELYWWANRKPYTGADLGEGAGVHTPPSPWDDLWFSNTTGILQKKNYVVYWCWGEQETSAPPPKKNPGSAPVTAYEVLLVQIESDFSFKECAKNLILSLCRTVQKCRQDLNTFLCL